MTRPHDPDDVVIVGCAMTGCPELFAPDARALDDLTARGGWLCHRHHPNAKEAGR